MFARGLVIAVQIRGHLMYIRAAEIPRQYACFPLRWRSPGNEPRPAVTGRLRCTYMCVLASPALHSHCCPIFCRIVRRHCRLRHPCKQHDPFSLPGPDESDTSSVHRHRTRLCSVSLCTVENFCASLRMPGPSVRAWMERAPGCVPACVPACVSACVSAVSERQCGS